MKRLLTILIVTLIALAALLPATASADSWSWWDCKTAVRQPELKQFACFAVLTWDDGTSVEVNFGAPAFRR